MSDLLPGLLMAAVAVLILALYATPPTTASGEEGYDPTELRLDALEQRIEELEGEVEFWKDNVRAGNTVVSVNTRNIDLLRRIIKYTAKSFPGRARLPNGLGEWLETGVRQ